MPATAATIFALSSAPGRAGVAVIRISGPRAGDALDAMAGLPRPPPRFAAFRKLRHPESKLILDEALVLFFAGPRSETGEDTAELHIHGGRAVIASVLGALDTISGCRPAVAGEFARRAFENGKLDLTALEGLADLVDAETEAQRVQALAQSGGSLARLYDGWRSDLLQALALVEAGIDFSDEGDVSAQTMRSALQTIEPLLAAIATHLAGAHRGEILRSGFRVALVGAPNAGKSSLLNALARRDVAIVSPEPGTTRDVLEVRLDLSGVPVIISDTAGLRDTGNAIEQEGIRRARKEAASADLVLHLRDLTETSSRPTPPLDGPKALWIVGTKTDIAGSAGATGVMKHRISSRTGDGLQPLIDAIAAAARASVEAGAGPPPTQDRHRRHLQEAIGHLSAFMGGSTDQTELRAEDLRLAASALGRITGRIDAEQVLDQIFSRFCIGK